MHLILTGATGLVGTAVLDAMIRTKDITKISVISRRPVKFQDDRVDVILHKDFASYDAALLEKLRGAQACVWALGISQTQVSKEEYIEITKTYPLAAAKAFQTLRPSNINPQQKQERSPFHFVYISGDGATFTPGYLTPFFGRIKGETELALDELARSHPSTLRATSVRPAFVDWTGHPELKPYLPAMSTGKSVLGSVMSAVFSNLVKSKSSPTEPLGRFLTGIAMGLWDDALDGTAGVQRLPGEGGLTVVDNSALRKLIGLDK